MAIGRSAIAVASVRLISFHESTANCTALSPSIYEPYESDCHDAGCQPLKLNTEYVNATVGEAVRISKSLDTPLPVLPYAWYRYHDGEPKGMQFLTAKDTQ